MKTASVSDLLKLSLAERIQLAFDLWDSIAEIPDAVDLTDDQMKELDKRLEAYHTHPEQGSPWGEVLARLRINSWN